MKAAILAGGQGTCLSEVTTIMPGALVEVRGKLILKHIASIHAAHGLNESVVAPAIQGEVIWGYSPNCHNQARSLFSSPRISHAGFGSFARHDHSLRTNS
jgi:NDP-sugar pyrophosphorylase family protein